MTLPHIDGEVRDGRHHMQVRVYYEDTDFSGIVYHANYLRFMERGRTNHLRLMGADQHALFEQAQAETPGFAFVVRSMEIDFLRPARMDDLLDVVTWPVAVKGASITLAQEVRRGDEVLVKAKVRVAFICEGRAQPIPKSLRALMKADLELIWPAMLDSLYRSVQSPGSAQASEMPDVASAIAAVHARDRRPEGAHGGGRLEFARSGTRLAGLYRGQHVA